MMPNRVFHWDRPLPAGWLDRLASVAAVTPKPHQAHLQLWWEPGAPDQPVQRWVLYEAVPRAYVHELKLGLLMAVRPCVCPMEGQTLRVCTRCGGMQSFGRARIQRYLEETNCLALPFWVIQGDHGGHPVEFDETEANWDTLRGGTGEAPAPGSLTYAPFDERVTKALRARDRLRLAYASLQQAFPAQRAEAERQFRLAWSAYVDDQVGEAAEQLARIMPQLDLPTGPTVDVDAAEEQYIATGHLDAPGGTFRPGPTIKVRD